jgi:chromate transporter
MAMHSKDTSDMAAKPDASVADIFFEFLLIGATSFGNVVPYLRNSLVARRQWIDDNEFVELLSISETLPGLNSTTIAILLGDRLCGVAGSVAAIVGVCLPGALVMYLVGIVYNIHGDRPIVTAMLKGVAAAAVGLTLATIVQLGRKSLTHRSDLIFVAATVLGVNQLHQPVPRVLLAVGLLAVLWYRPGKGATENGSR